MPTGVSLAGKSSADSSCFSTDGEVCTTIVWQFGNTLTVAVDPPGRFTDTFNMSLTGTTLTGGISGSVVNPVGGNYSFSLPKAPN